MKKKVLIVVAILSLIVGVSLVYSNNKNKIEEPTVVTTVSDISANPIAFLGNVTVTGHAGEIMVDRGVFVLVDATGCCKINILVPFTQEQKTELRMTRLYTGSMPETGEPLEVIGNLKQVGNNFIFDVERITRNGEVIIRRAR